MKYSLDFSRLCIISAVLCVRDKVGLGSQLLSVCPVQTCWALHHYLWGRGWAWHVLTQRGHLRTARGQLLGVAQCVISCW